MKRTRMKVDRRDSGCLYQDYLIDGIYTFINLFFSYSIYLPPFTSRNYSADVPERHSGDERDPLELLSKSCLRELM
jgi:hypothetical protein